jgi:hypothetical protein
MIPFLLKLWRVKLILPSIPEEDVYLNEAEKLGSGHLLELRQLAGIMLECFLCVGPAPIGTQGHKVKMERHIILQHILPNAKKPVAAQPGMDCLGTPVEIREDGAELMDLVLKRFFGECSKFRKAFTQSLF